MARWNYQPVFIETGGTDITNMNWRGLEHKPCLIFGNEGLGSPDYLMRDLPRVSINQRGVLRSLNVAVAAGIACYEISKALS
jgi:tRNA G18 (ribose-2'-O)-methylase SpoU